jgi:hypothetical protein
MAIAGAGYRLANVPGHHRLMFDAARLALGSSAAPSAGDQVKILSDVLGTRIEYVPVTDETARKGMEQARMPAYVIDALLPVAAFIRGGRAADVLPTVEEVLGKQPLAFVDWAREHAGAFR